MLVIDGLYWRTTSLGCKQKYTKPRERHDSQQRWRKFVRARCLISSLTLTNLWQSQIVGMLHCALPRKTTMSVASRDHENTPTAVSGRSPHIKPTRCMLGFVTGMILGRDFAAFLLSNSRGLFDGGIKLTKKTVETAVSTSQVYTTTAVYWPYRRLGPPVPREERSPLGMRADKDT